MTDPLQSIYSSDISIKDNYIEIEVSVEGWMALFYNDEKSKE